MGVRNDYTMEKLDQWVEDNMADDVAVIRLDGFDDCVVGSSFNGEHLIYDSTAIVEKLAADFKKSDVNADREVETDDEYLDQAWDYFGYNILGLCFTDKEGEPILLNPMKFTLDDDESKP